jgi:hypothetical protein
LRKTSLPLNPSKVTHELARAINNDLSLCLQHYQQQLWTYNQRMSNYADLSFSDEEVITLYLFGVIDKHRKIKQTYAYADRHLRPYWH